MRSNSFVLTNTTEMIVLQFPTTSSPATRKSSWRDSQYLHKRRNHAKCVLALFSINEYNNASRRCDSFRYSAH